MKIINFLLMLLFAMACTTGVNAQGLQPNECGVRFTYDAAGNLLQRDYICNNSGQVMNRATNTQNNKKDTMLTANKPGFTPTGDDVVLVSSIVPNPTSGRFTIILSRVLTNEQVVLLDLNGKVLQKRKDSGNRLSFDISTQAAGMYFIRIEGGGTVSTFKVVKQ